VKSVTEQNKLWDFNGEYGAWKREWDDDWDHRSPFPGQDTKKYKGKIRHIYLIRHGQYELDDKAHGLTPLGKEQARITGDKLKHMMEVEQKDHYGTIKVKFSSVSSSNLLRARQTAEIIHSVLGGDVVLEEPDAKLEEGMPLLPIPRGKTSFDTTSPSRVHEESVRVESGFRAYVHRDIDYKRKYLRSKKKDTIDEGFAPEKEEKTEAEKPEHEYEVICCHMNIIRYFVCRALQFPPEAWLRMRGDNCGITEIIVYPNGRVSLGRFSDAGHLKNDQITFH